MIIRKTSMRPATERGWEGASCVCGREVQRWDRSPHISEWKEALMAKAEEGRERQEDAQNEGGRDCGPESGPRRRVSRKFCLAVLSTKAH